MPLSIGRESQPPCTTVTPCTPYIVSSHLPAQVNSPHVSDRELAMDQCSLALIYLPTSSQRRSFSVQLAACPSDAMHKFRRRYFVLACSWADDQHSGRTPRAEAFTLRPLVPNFLAPLGIPNFSSSSFPTLRRPMAVKMATCLFYTSLH